MSTRHITSFHFPLCVAFVVAALANGTVLAQDTAIKVNCGSQLTALQQRLYQKAEDGPDALRQFIFIRRGILQIDTYETAAWANSVNERRAACMRKSAQMEAAPSEAT